MTFGNSRRAVSRRSFLAGASAFVGTRVLHAATSTRGIGALSGRVWAWVGTYTGAHGAAGHGEGIEQFELDLRTGDLRRHAPAVRTPNPSWITLHPSKKYLYAVNEVDDFDGHNGAVSAFAIDRHAGTLRTLNTVSSGGAIPAYCSVDPAGRFLFVANYGGGSIAVLPIRPDGSLGFAVQIHRDHGSVGRERATDAPPESLAISGHDAPHAHMIAADPHNRFVLATDLGQDRIYTYRFDAATGSLTAAPGRGFTPLPSGDGPRHFAFHPNGRWLYSIQEEASTVAMFDYDSKTGSLDRRQTVSTLPAGFAGTNFASEILISPDGRNLYAANRLHDTIAIFSIGADGRLKWLGEASTMGDYPRSCAIDPGGRFLFACDQLSDAITSFRIEPGAGLLRFTGRYTGVGSPASLVFLD